EIGFDRLVTKGLFGVAGAEPAEPVAIGNMRIERQAVRLSQPRQSFRIDLRTDPFVEMRGGRVACIARNRGRKASYECVLHGISPSHTQITPKGAPPFDFDQVKAGGTALRFDNSQEALFCREAARFMFMPAWASTTSLRRLPRGERKSRHGSSPSGYP